MRLSQCLPQGAGALDLDVCSAAGPSTVTNEVGTIHDDQAGSENPIDCTQGGCGGLDTGSNGYGDNLDCGKTIEAPAGFTIELTFTALNTEGTTVCWRCRRASRTSIPRGVVIAPPSGARRRQQAKAGTRCRCSTAATPTRPSSGSTLAIPSPWRSDRCAAPKHAPKAFAATPRSCSTVMPPPGAPADRQCDPRHLHHRRGERRDFRQFRPGVLRRRKRPANSHTRARFGSVCRLNSRIAHPRVSQWHFIENIVDVPGQVRPKPPSLEHLSIVYDHALSSCVKNSAADVSGVWTAALPGDLPGPVPADRGPRHTARRRPLRHREPPGDAPRPTVAALRGLQRSLGSISWIAQMDDGRAPWP